MPPNLASVFIHHESGLRKFLRRFTSNTHDLEDLCQEIIVCALEAERTREINNPEGYLYGVAKNLVRKDLDRKSRALVEFVDDFSGLKHDGSEFLVEDVIDARERMLLFMEAVSALPSQCQRVFLLKKVYGHSHVEIGRMLRISVSTVEKHAALGLKRCSQHLDRALTDDTQKGKALERPRLVT